MADVRAIQRTTRQSPYKMRLVDRPDPGQERERGARACCSSRRSTPPGQIEKVLESAVANAEYKGRTANEPVDVDLLYVKHAMINEGPKLKRFMPAAMGRATPIQKRTSHVEIVVAPRAVAAADRPAAPRARAASPARSATKHSTASTEGATKTRTRKPKRGQ